jgi:hypothetical protein
LAFDGLVGIHIPRIDESRHEGLDSVIGTKERDRKGREEVSITGSEASTALNELRTFSACTICDNTGMSDINNIQFV